MTEATSKYVSAPIEQSEDDKKEEERKKEKEKSKSVVSRACVPRKLLPKVKKAKPGDTLMQMEDTFRDRWFIKGLIGQGGYGEIYLAIDMKQAEEVAIKVEPLKRRGKTAKRMILEQKVLLRLQGRPHVPKMLACGHDSRINFIIMQLLSVNVGDLKKASPVKRLSQSTTGRIVQQAIAGLRDVHTAGYLHRDVKPANMCFGIMPHTRHVLMLVDFGLVRRYKNLDGTIRPQRVKAGFRGTLRYVSLRVHERLEQAPADDLISVLYSAIELMIGELPWKYMSRNDDVKRAKEELQSCDPDSFLSLTSVPFQEFARAVISLNGDEEPNYTALQGLLNELVGDKRLSDPYDWENEYRDAIEASTHSETKSEPGGNA